MAEEQQNNGLQFEDIVPYVNDSGDTGLTSRLKLKRNFDKIKLWAQQVAASVGNLTTTIGNLATSIENALSGLDDKYLSKTNDDTAAGTITFADGVTFGDGNTGIDENGDAELRDATMRDVTGRDAEFENLRVTKEAHFFKLVVDELLSNKGAIIISSANCVVEATQEDQSTYTVYFSKTGKDGVEVNNPWVVGDHALCLTFKGEGAGTFSDVKNRYYWRKVVYVYSDITYEGKTYHAISLSKTIGEGSTVPAAGDNIVQLGYSGQTSIPARQTAIILSSYPTMDTGVTPPSLAFYKGINDFTLSSHRYTYMDGVANEFFGDFKVLVNNSYTSMTTLLATTNRLIAEIRNDLGTVGVDINSDDMTINLKAGKVNFLMPDDSTNAKISIDPTTGTLHAVDGEFEGTVRATNLFHSVCYFTEGNTIDNGEYYSNENSNVLYYYNEDLVSETPPTGFVDGNYYTEEEIGEHKGDACFIPTTGKADVAMCMPRVGYNWEPDNYGRLPYIRLPKPEDFQGKVVEVSGFCYAENNSGTFVKTFGVRCVCSDFDPNDRRMSGLVYSDPNGYPSAPIRTVIPYTETVISTGGTARFMSVELSDGSWVWVLLANQTGGDVYIGDGSISGGTVTEVGMSVPTGFSVSPSIITTNGTFALSFGGTLTKNRVLATPSSADGAPSWRSLVADDIPSLAASKITSGTFDAARIPNLSWNKITSDKPTTLAGYGITDAKIDGDVITLGGNTITPVTSLTGYATQSWVDSQPFVTESAFSGMLSEEAYISDDTIYIGGNSITPITDGDLGDYVSVDAGGMYSHPMKTQSKVELHKSIYGNGCIEFYGGTTESLKGSLDVDNNGNLRWTANSATKRVLLAGDANNIPLYDSNGGWSGGITSMSGLRGYFHYVDAGVYELDYLPKSGGTLSSTLTIATGFDRKLILNNTNNELWNIIGFYQNGTEVGYLGLCGSNALAWNGYEITLKGNDNNFITHGNEFTFASAGYGGDVSEFPNGRMVWFNYRTASGNLDGNISSYKFGDGKGGQLAEITNGQFSGNAASAGALKYSGNTKVEATSSGAAVTGDLKASSLTVDAGYSTFVEQSLELTTESATYNTQFYTGGSVRDNTCVFAFNGAIETTGGLTINDTLVINRDNRTMKITPTNSGYFTNTVAYTLYDNSGYALNSANHYFTGNIVASGSITQSSDIRKKDASEYLEPSVYDMAQAPIVKFRWKGDTSGREHVGTVAQYWRDVVPQIVGETPDGMLTMDYATAGVVAGVTAARKAVELERRIEEQDRRIKELEQIINQLKGN